MDLFRVRLNCIDHYQSTPTRYDPQLRNDIRASQVSKAPKVPVVRVFGSTETGQKVCAHIHGAFPYLYIQYDGSLAADEVGAFIYRLHLSIDHALAVSYRRDQYGENAKFVARITLVKGVPFFGYHIGYRFFLKIYMFNPIVMTRLVDLLQQGVIMKRKFQPYEAHLQYLLQFMTDYNLYGCDYLDASVAHFRAPVPDPDDGTHSSHLWHSQSVSADHVTEDPALPRVSHCSIEVDLCVQDILNRKNVKERQLHHDFIERVNPLPGDMKLVSSMAGLWRDESKRGRRQMGLAKMGESPFPPEVHVTMSADPRQSQAMGWIHEEEYREEIQKLIESEEASSFGLKLEFESFVQPARDETTVNTALESVEDLFPKTLLRALGLSSSQPVDPTSSIEVDESRVSRVQKGDEDFFPEDSDEEALRELGDALIPPSAQEAAPIDKHVLSDANADRLPHEKLLGVCTSGLKTGRIPHIPTHRQLLDAIEEEGLVSRASKPLADGLPPFAPLKRKASKSFIAASATKRARHDFSSQSTTSDLVSQGWLMPSNQGATKNPNESFKFDASQESLSSMILMSPPGHNQSTNPDSPDVTMGTATTPATLRRSRGSASQTQTTPGKRVTFDATDPSSQSVPPRSSLSTATSEPSEFEAVHQALKASSAGVRSLVFAAVPPVIDSVSSSFQGSDIPDVVYRDAFYGKESDVPTRLREYAGREFRLGGNTTPFLPHFDPSGTSAVSFEGTNGEAIDKVGFQKELATRRTQCSWASWEFSKASPSYGEVDAWWNQRLIRAAERQAEGRQIRSTPRRYASQVDGPTPRNKHGFTYTQKRKTTSVEHEAQYMSTMSVELHVNTRGKFVPNPEEDEIQCIFFAIKSDETTIDSQDPSASIQSGMIVLCNDGSTAPRMRKQSNVEIVEESSELDLMVRLVEVVRNHDPDILTGYEVHGSSWGYVIERARLKYEYNLCDELSRMKTESHGRFGKENDRWGFTTTSSIRVTGRHMINIWRAMRSELNLLQYTMENVAWHVLHRRIPHYSWKVLTDWYTSRKPQDLTKLLGYYQIRTRLDIEILEANELVARTSEQARLLGVDFFSVFSRGSQFKVESIMFRIAKPENFLLVSPSRKQVGGQNALECLPLVMEPQSDFYTSPLLVLDFQSLYPSVMIAYNLCYSTFLGRITNWRGMNKMGFTEYKRQQGLLALLKDHINIAPNGMMYAKAEIRKSLLAKMLTEILETRVMVKSGMKKDKDDKMLQQLLNNRQLALKLLANVTYGYTSASFSGRMPCSEIADSIVQTGRETLERAIAFIHSTEKWGAEVVYGDTDSLFVYLKGRTRDEAFNIGNEIAAAITDMNPRPIKLKFEKVYHPCVLLAKKRYVGYKYESKDQVIPEFDAKGIETVRRDGTPAEQKIEEKALKLLFETADLSQIKEYFQTQCEKIMRGSVSIQDFCFAREVKLGTYSDKGAPPAGALISTRRMLEDARAEPQYGERVPYVVITGAPGARLIDRCVAPEDLLANPHWQLDAEYYISKNLIPPLERIFNLVGANVRGWYDEMPKIQRIRTHAIGQTRKTTLESYLKSTHCLVCTRRFTPERGAQHSSLCSPCRRKPGASILALQGGLSAAERGYAEILSICKTCSGLSPAEEVKCDSKDCPAFWTRMKQLGKVHSKRASAEPVIQELVARADRLALEW